MREEALIESLPDDGARERYIAKNLHGYEQPDSGLTIEEVIAEYERNKAAAEAAAQPSATDAKIAELYKHPAMMDAKHPSTMPSCSSSSSCIRTEVVEASVPTQPRLPWCAGVACHSPEPHPR
jgi:hypothetical protein